MSKTERCSRNDARQSMHSRLCQKTVHYVLELEAANHAERLRVISSEFFRAQLVKQKSCLGICLHVLRSCLLPLRTTLAPSLASGLWMLVPAKMDCTYLNLLENARRTSGYTHSQISSHPIATLYGGIIGYQRCII